MKEAQSWPTRWGKHLIEFVPMPQNSQICKMRTTALITATSSRERYRSGAVVATFLPVEQKQETASSLIVPVKLDQLFPRLWENRINRLLTIYDWSLFWTNSVTKNRARHAATDAGLRGDDLL